MFAKYKILKTIPCCGPGKPANFRLPQIMAEKKWILEESRAKLREQHYAFCYFALYVKSYTLYKKIVILNKSQNNQTISATLWYKKWLLTIINMYIFNSSFRTNWNILWSNNIIYSLYREGDKYISLYYLVHFLGYILLEVARTNQ